MKRVVSLIAAVLMIHVGFSQDTLPGFSVIERGNRVVVSWINPYESCIQLNVQRSYDSLKYFRTVYSATSPSLPQNGFSEAKQPNNKTYYRIFYVLAGGAYFFTPAKQAVPDLNARTVNLPDKSIAIKNITVHSRNGLLAIITSNNFGRFKDSILRQTKDTLFAINDSLVELRQFVAKEVWKPSIYVFTNKDGYLNIALPDAAHKKYTLKVFEDNGTELFEINRVREPVLTLDKANFIHAGWFHFELYEDNVLKEKNKFYLPKDF